MVIGKKPLAMVLVFMIINASLISVQSQIQDRIFNKSIENSNINKDDFVMNENSHNIINDNLSENNQLIFLEENPKINEQHDYKIPEIANMMWKPSKDEVFDFMKGVLMTCGLPLIDDVISFVDDQQQQTPKPIVLDNGKTFSCLKEDFKSFYSNSLEYRIYDEDIKKATKENKKDLSKIFVDCEKLKKDGNIFERYRIKRESLNICYHKRAKDFKDFEKVKKYGDNVIAEFVKICYEFGDLWDWEIETKGFDPIFKWLYMNGRLLENEENVEEYKDHKEVVKEHCGDSENLIK